MRIVVRPPTVQSFSFDQGEILRNIVRLHCPNGIDADLTYGNGKFYEHISMPKYCFDVQPLHPHVKKSDSRKTPLKDGSIRSLMFDPPFVTYIKQGRVHNSIMARRFGGYYAYSELENHYKETLIESARILATKGVMVFKCQDIIHNHKMHCTHANVIAWAALAGFRLKDLFVLGAKHRMPGPQKGEQKHARIHHSYFLVLERR